MKPPYTILAHAQDPPNSSHLERDNHASPSYTTEASRRKPLYFKALSSSNFSSYSNGDTVLIDKNELLLSSHGVGSFVPIKSRALSSSNRSSLSDSIKTVVDFVASLSLTRSDDAKTPFRERASPSSARKARVTILMQGQMARPHCYGKARQWDAIKSQHNSLFKPLKNRGFDVNLLLATNRCDNDKSKSGKEPSWESLIRTHYSPVLKGLYLDNCNYEVNNRCLMHRVLLLLWDRHVSDEADGSKYSGVLRKGERQVNALDWVFFTRPDMVFKARGAELVLAMISNSEKRIMWPFKCEPDAWNAWECVADTLVAVPTVSLAAYRSACLGYAACYPEAHEKAKLNIHHFDNGAGAHIAYGYSGHACYRCVKLAKARFHDSRTMDSQVLKVNATATSILYPLDDQVWFGEYLLGDDYSAFNLMSHPVYASVLAAATQSADDSSLNVTSETSKAAADVFAIKWEPIVAATACKAACKEAVGCRAWSAGASADALELGQRARIQANGSNKSFHGQVNSSESTDRFNKGSSFGINRTEQPHIEHHRTLRYTNVSDVSNSNTSLAHLLRTYIILMFLSESIFPSRIGHQLAQSYPKLKVSFILRIYPHPW